jgi:hypothetical protein
MAASRPLNFFANNNALPPQNEANINWQSQEVVSEAYLQQLEKKIVDNFPRLPSYIGDFWESYPDDAIKSAELSRSGTFWLRYNPFELSMPSELLSSRNFYNHLRISSRDVTCDMGPHVLTPIQAAKGYFDFIKEYNLAYIAVLRALNGANDHIELVKKLFSQATPMFTAAKSRMDFLSSSVTDPRFLLAMVAYLTLSIVYSKDENITTLARVRVLEFVKYCFNSNEVGGAFDRYKSGYAVKRLEHAVYDAVPVHDLIPKRFISAGESSATTAHNNIFLNNGIMQYYFPPMGRGIMLDAGIPIIISNYSQEAAQVMQSLLRVTPPYPVQIPKGAIFVSLVSMAQLNDTKKVEIFGRNASYRNNGESLGSGPILLWQQLEAVAKLNAENDRKLVVPPRPDPERAPVVEDVLNTYSAAMKAYIDSFKDKKSFSTEIAELQLSEDEKKLLEKYCDAITYEFVNIPVMLEETLYDLSSIAGFNNIDPFTKLEFTLREIRPGRAVAEEMRQVLAQIRKAREAAAPQPMPMRK